MKTLPSLPTFVLAVSASLASAQQPVDLVPPPPPQSQTGFTAPSLNAPPVTPELWVYSQEMRRHDDPALAVRRKAEIVADQRMARLAAMKWYGLSNSRPVANPTPFTGQYSPAWVGNGWDRYDYVPVGSNVTLYVESSGTIR
jgi:hypothetical protein